MTSILHRVHHHWSDNHTDSPLLLCLNHRCAVRNGVRRQSGGAAAPWDEDAPQKTVSVRV